MQTLTLGLLSGALVGLVLGLIGGGGSVLAMSSGHLAGLRNLKIV